MTVDTGPNASTSWTAVDVQGSSVRSRIGSQEGAAGEPGERVGIADDDPRAGGHQLGDLARGHRRAARRLTSAPIRFLVARVADLGRLQPVPDRGLDRVEMLRPGAMARRMAVHFCPALTVISVTTSLTNRSNSGVPGAASGPSSEAFRLSCSATNLHRFRAATTGWERNFSAVEAEPVKLTTSWPVRWSNRSPTPPTISCTAPGGSRPLSIITRNAASHR